MRNLKTKHLERLLEENPISYYWMGFIAADGTFMKRGKTNSVTYLGVCAATDDLPHLKEYAKFVEFKGTISERKPLTKNYQSLFNIQINNKILVPKIADKFQFKHRKTYNPPTKFPETSSDNLISFVVGLVDGDGTIKRRGKKQNSYSWIRCHGNWLAYFEHLSELLKKNKVPGVSSTSFALTKYRGIKDRTNATLTIDQTRLKYFKTIINKYNLPVLSRKWNRVNENLGRDALTEFRKQEVIRLTNEGKTSDDIALLLNLGRGYINRLKRDLGLGRGKGHFKGQKRPPKKEIQSLEETNEDNTL